MWYGCMRRTVIRTVMQIVRIRHRVVNVLILMILYATLICAMSNSVRNITAIQISLIYPQEIFAWLVVVLQTKVA